MKKMNKMYEAPVAEIFEMRMPVALQINTSTGNEIGGGGYSGDENPDNE